MTRETKVGLMMVALLVGVFGFLIYQRIHRPLEGLAVQDSPKDRSAREVPEASDEEELSHLEQSELRRTERPSVSQLLARDEVKTAPRMKEERGSEFKATQWKNSPPKLPSDESDEVEFDSPQQRTSVRKASTPQNHTVSFDEDFAEATTVVETPKVIPAAAQIPAPDPFDLDEQTEPTEDDSAEEDEPQREPRPLVMPPADEETSEVDEPSFDEDPSSESAMDLEPVETTPALAPTRNRQVYQTSEYDTELQPPPGSERRPAPVAIDETPFSPEPSRTVSTARGSTYVIEPNDNFWVISRKRYGEGRFYMALARHNQQVISDPKRMRPGTTIETPDASVLEQLYSDVIPKPAAPESAPGTTTSRPRNTEEANPAGFFISSDGQPMYRIADQDTLSDIAKSHLGRSSRWVQILEMNRNVLQDGNELKIGTVLRLPADASRVQVVGATREYR
ncbi:LysM peptidoglycan-binding domain-containing protein [Schlesneria sp. T3-172]|uniref:LysM peptidoglycan-binding domain-containing protein n=1 Tax=Schlesneria sphaerica TaxID=3373610 RepID=UPI0037C9351D